MEQAVWSVARGL